MKTTWHRVFCGPVGNRRGAGTTQLHLNLGGPEPSVHLRISDISRSMAQNIPPVLVDLVEIAAYVFAADQQISRGGPFDAGGRWRRRMDFRIPVRFPQLWSRAEVLDSLVDTLSFLTDDEYRFSFSMIRKPVPVQQYLELDDSSQGGDFDQVQLFSGGVDSLAGAIQASHREGKNIVLVSHRSGAKRVPRTDDLYASLRRRSPSRILRVPVWATNAGHMGIESTQRSRSFLYAALATTVASLLGLDAITFYENGVTSMNLPIAGQVVGARATRTTHPQTLRGFERLVGAILGKTFSVHSPFLWNTKTDVMGFVAERDSDLLPLSVSCSRTIEATTMHPHCGRCSQCLDRRFAALALRLGDDVDPSSMYKVDLLTGERGLGEDRAMAEAFVLRARAMATARDDEFFRLFPEASRVLRHTGLSADEAATRVLDVHRRHGRDVRSVLTEGLRSHADEFEAGVLSDSCLLTLTVPDKYTQRITEEGEAQTQTLGPSLVCEGVFWRVRFEGETLTLRDSQGLRYLGFLLRAPGREFHCGELSMMQAGEVRPFPAETNREMTDPVSIRECRQRANQLPSEISEAEGRGDAESVVILKEELAQIRRHLAQVTGRAGRPRLESDAGERARKAVRAAVSRALREIDRLHHSILRRHLGRSLKMGTYCAYRPDTPVRWTVKTPL